MNLHGRNLSIRMRGEDVALLQRELQQLDFTVDVAELSDKRFGTTTRDGVQRFQREQGLHATGVVDQETALRINAELDARTGESAGDMLAVRGTLLNPDSSPVQGNVVKAFDRGLRVETPLGEATTSAEGAYEIRYRSLQLRPEGKHAADLVVRAFDTAGNELARSEQLCRAPAEAVVDLVVGNVPLRGPSEYEMVVATIRPYLNDRGIADLEREDVRFLECSAEVDRLHLATLIVASRLAKETSLPDWLFYAFGRQGVRLQLEAMVVIRTRNLRDALDRAIEANIVPPVEAAVIDPLFERLQAALVRAEFAEPTEGVRFTLGALLGMGTSLAGRDLQEAFLARYLARPDSLDEFWKSLEDDERFSPEVIGDFRLTLLLGRLTRYRLPVLQQIKSLRENGEVNSLRDVTRLDRSRWREMLQAAEAGGGLDLPEDLPGETHEDRLEHYITSLRAPIESLFPSDSLRRALTAAPDTSTGVRRFLENTQDLDLYWTNIDSYLGEHRDTALSGIAEDQREAVVARVKGMQRLLRVTPRADQVRVLDAAGYDSALAIARTPKRRFRKHFADAVDKLKDTLGDAYMVTVASAEDEGGEAPTTTLMMMNSAATPNEVAGGIHAAAVSAAGYHLSLYANLKTNLQSLPDAIGGSMDLQKKVKDDVFKAMPNLETLFGAQSFCECEHCRSVYSPAAYLVDLLHFLDDLSKENGALIHARPADAPTPIGELLRRRSDIAHIPLTCENTNTPLPYVDLVNEALESYVASHLNADEDWTDIVLANMPIQPFDTGNATAEELRAVPQHVHPAVYTHLATKAVYPMTLPFHRPLEVARAYLGHLGTTRQKIIEVFAPASPPSQLALLMERLRICPAQYENITAAQLANPPFDAGGLKDLWEYYGYTSGAELANLIAVPELLHRTGMAFEDLLAVLKTRFMNPELYLDPATTPSPKVVKIEFPSSPKDDACDVSKMKLTNLDPVGDTAFAHDWLDRLHRLIRLWRALGWAAADVDRAITAVAGANPILDDAMLAKLADVKELVDTLGESVPSLIAQWNDIDTWGMEAKATSGVVEVTHPEESQYSRVFLSRAVLQDDETRKVFEDAVLSPSEMLDDHMSSIAAALAVTEEDVGRIREHAKGMDGANVQLDLKTLSTLYRYATLAKALEIRVRDLITMLRLVPDSMNPFSPGDPDSALDFVRTVRSVEVSGFSIPLLNYLFRDEAEPTRHPAPTRILVKRTLETLQKGLAAIHQEMQVAEQPPADILRSRLELAAPMLALEVPKGIDQALAVLDPRVTEFAGKVLALQDRTTFVNDHFTTFLPTPGQVLFGTPLPASADLQDKAKRFVDNVIKVRDALIPWLRRQLEERLVFETMANAVGKDQTIVQRLLRNVLLAWTGMPQPSTALEYFLSLVNQQGIATDMDLDEDPPKPPALEFVRTFTRVFKAAAYTGSFDMTESELRLFTSPPSPLPTFDPGAGLAFELNELPLEAVAPSSAAPGKLFEVWGALQSFFTLRDSLPRTEKTLVDYFEASDKATRQKILAEAAGWDDKQIIAVATSMGLPNLPLTTPDLIRFHRGMELLKRVGATPAHMFAWAANIPDHAQADDIVQTVKARYERARWLEVARGLNDPLREKQRNALVALLLGRYAPIAILEQPHPELKKGANRPAVFELQRKLNAALPGAPPLLVDGIFSQNTYATVVLFQSTRGLATDGIVGPFTWSALDQVGPPLKDSSDLFDYFLIDVEMSSCMLTSRVKQAISSVQLFVQRCLLNLEPAVSPEEIDVDRWEWMKHYRIWEANRKVFLYPETYILPELRDDKTPFFRELETDLLQNELTEKTIETAFVSYLCKLDEVARLDIRGFCKEDEDGKETYHLFGRTWNRPYVYYYRCGTFTVDSGQGEWSPWERLDLNIEGDHLVPMVYNRRLHLFWVVFEEEADKDAATPKVEGQEPAVKWAVKATWSQNVGGKWTPSFSARERLSAYPQTSIVDGKTRYQLHDTWRYRVSASVDDESLSLVIRRSWSPEFLSGHKAGNRSGAFVLVGCHKGLSAVGGNEKAEAEWLFYGPDHSVIRGMALESNNNTLYLPAVTATPIFDQIPEKFWVLPPSTLDVASSQEWFPFCFTDTELDYFARPIVETIGAHAASAETTFNEVVHLEHVSFKEALGPDLVFDLMLAAGDGHG